MALAVRPSVALEPVSVAAVSPVITGVAGPAPSIVIVRAVEAALWLPAASEAVTVML